MASSRRLHRNLALASVASFLVGASSVHCGSTGAGNSHGNSNSAGTSGTFNTGGSGTASGSAVGGSSSSFAGPSGSGGSITFDVQTKDYSAEDFFNTDPPPMSCDGGGKPPVVTGTPECPSDKNNPGCPCATAGATAPCWTGPRKFRDHGNCHDGTTTCLPSGETQQLAWGMCNGEVLPMGTTGKAACECFSKGLWQIDNLEPCFLTVTNSMGSTTTGYSATSGNPASCPFDSMTAMPTLPATWSKNTLKVDCSGNFKLCYAIKAGDPKNPKPTDCSVIQECTSAYYFPANSVANFPDLPAWTSDPSAAACVQQFLASGGYGEMSVDGQSDECELVNKVFQRVPYCPPSCNGSDAGICGTCQNGGSGSF